LQNVDCNQKKALVVDKLKASLRNWFLFLSVPVERCGEPGANHEAMIFDARTSSGVSVLFLSFIISTLKRE
jgi:hypothetical protein